uniref:Alpha-type protein kinase domain-containing protein n=1 Tax=Psilocybe cubensis TaxID=181762 RepID=A0A8H8CMT2_PSICU
MEAASEHMKKASNTRLAQTPIAYKSPGLVGFQSKNRNLDSAAKIQAESNRNKLNQMKEFQIIERFDPDISTKLAFDKILLRIRDDFEAKHPGTEQLTWANVSVYAQENQTRFSSLQHFDQAKSMVTLFKEEFLKKKIGSQKKLENREIDIRLTYEKTKVFNGGGGSVLSDDDDSDGIECLGVSLALLGNKRKRSIPAGSSRRLRKEAHGSRSALFSAKATNSQDQVVVLKSAWLRMKASDNTGSWTRNVQMVPYKFIRTSVTYDIQTGHLVWTKEMVEETIEIAEKWHSKSDSGFIGEGFTKRGIYAQFGGKEYVLTQPVGISSSTAQHVLREEYKLLCQGDAFKAEFDKLAIQVNMKTISRFYFNFASSIFGEIVPSPASDGFPLPCPYFIATLLLSCGEADPGIRKFTGNNIAENPEDHLAQAIHAFAHFSAVYSDNQLLFCDLQGARDKQGIMCLIDPQYYSTTESPVY